MGSEEDVRRLVLTAADRRDLLLVVDYVLDVHHLIDPDAFDIDAGRLAAAKHDLEGGSAFDVTYQSVLFLELLIDAAAEYSLRRSSGIAVDLPPVRLQALTARLASAEDELFRSTPDASGGPAGY